MSSDVEKFAESFIRAQAKVKKEEREAARLTRDQEATVGKVQLLYVMEVPPILQKLYGEYLKGYAARYKPSHGQWVSGYLLEFDSDEVDIKIFSRYHDDPNNSDYFKTSIYGYSREITVTLLGETARIQIVPSNDKVYIELKTGYMGELATGYAISLLVGMNVKYRYKELMLRALTQYLVFKPGKVDLAGYEDTIEYCDNILACNNNSITNRHMLLVGEPGLGKSMIAKQLATMHPEYTRMSLSSSRNWVFYVQAISDIARNCNTKVLLIIDEIDELGLNRKTGKESVYELLRFMDGVEENTNIKIIATTNRPQDLDPALLRVGRFGPLIFIDKPNLAQKTEIIKYYADKYEADVDVDEIANKLNGESTGALIRASFEDCILQMIPMTTDSIIANYGMHKNNAKLLDNYMKKDKHTFLRGDE